MHARKLRIVKPPLPAIGICEACNSQFKSSKRSQDEAESEIKAAFEAYDCKVSGRTCAAIWKRYSCSVDRVLPIPAENGGTMNALAPSGQSNKRGSDGRNACAGSVIRVSTTAAPQRVRARTSWGESRTLIAQIHRTAIQDLRTETGSGAQYRS
jgi:hypothetical protein